MAQNITLLGASYPDVPAVVLPKTGGGTASFDDTTDANAVASDIAQGKTAYVNGVKVVGTSTGGSNGGSIHQDENGYLVLDKDAGDLPSGTINITTNGLKNVYAYAQANVSVQSTPTLQTKSVSYTPTETAQSASITADNGYDGLEEVDVSVGAISSSYVGSGITRRSSLDLDASGATVTAPAGYYASSASASVSSGTEGTPIATKGTVSNHSVSVTPSVTNSAGYISGSTKTGTAVTVSASELVSGNKEITSNGTNIDVANYSTVSVDVSSGGDDNYIAFLERSTTAPNLPTGLTSIGNYAFYYWTELLSVSIPSTVTSIGFYAFYYCTKLETISLPSGIAHIYNYAFQNCTKMVLTSLPSSLIHVGMYAFNSCSQLELTSLPNGITNIGDSAFRTCPKVALTSLPNSLTLIGSSAFANDYEMAISTIPSGVTSIGTSAFQYCYKIQSIYSEAVITSFGASSFNGSSTYHMSITSARFPNMAPASISTIFGSTTAANACQELTICDIGKTSAISSNAFANCYSLQTLIMRKTGSICTVASNSFTNTPFAGYNSLTGTAYVPSALISTYQTASQWSTLYNNGTITFVAIEGSQYELS